MKKWFSLFAVSAPWMLWASAGDSLLTVSDTVVLGQEIVVTAQRQPLSNFRSPLITTLVGPEYLQRRGPRSVPEALMGAPGVLVQKTNHGGGSPFLRGLTGQQTLLLVDGIRLNNAAFRSGPNQYLNTLDPAWMERIEVIQGSGSAEYGSDAIGGVLNVLTHTLAVSERTEWQPEAAFHWISGGMEASGQAGLQGSGQNWAFRAQGAYRNFGDLIAGKGIGKQTPTGYTQWSYAFKGLLRLSERFSATFLWQDLEQQDVPIYHKVTLENFQFSAFDPQRRRFGYARLSGSFDSKWLRQVELTASRQFHREVRTGQKNGQVIRTDETDETGTNGLQFNIFSNLAPFWSMTTGAEWYGDLVRSDKTDINTTTGQETDKRGLYPDGSRMHSLAAYNLHSLNWQRLTLTAGVRANTFRIRIPDDVIGTSELRPGALVGNLGISWEAVRGVRLFANASAAFRAPNVDDLGTLGIVDFRYELPNYDLEPEKSRSLELGLKASSKNFRGSLSAYYLELSDLIGRVRRGDTLQGYPVFLKENIAEAFIRGLESQAEWKAHPRWVFGGHASYTFGKNITANEPLRRIPPFNGRAYAEYVPGLVYGLRAEAVFAGAQRRLAAGDRSDNRINPDGTPAWQIFNLSGWRTFGKFHLSAELHNIFNEAYRIHGSGVDGMGRSLWLRVAIGGK